MGLSATLLLSAAAVVGASADKQSKLSLPGVNAASGKQSSAGGSLRALALTEADNDQDELATVVEVDLTTGKITQHGNFTWAVTVTGMFCSTDYTPGSAGYGPTWFGAISNDLHIAAVDAIQGTIIANVEVGTGSNYVISALNFDSNDGLLHVVGSSAPFNHYSYMTVVPQNGTVNVITDNINQTMVLPCETGISLATKRFFAINNDKADDDSDQTFVTIDLLSGKLESEVAWNSHKDGAPNALAVLSAYRPGNDTIFFVTVDHQFVESLRFYALDPMSGSIVLIAQLPKGNPNIVVDAGQLGVIPSNATALGAGADGNFTIAAFAFDVQSSENYLLLFNIPPPAQMEQLFAEALAQPSGAAIAAAADVQTPGSVTMIKVAADGLQMIWAPAWVPA